MSASQQSSWAKVLTIGHTCLAAGVPFLILSKMEILNIDERNELERCEVVIKQGLDTFVEVGQALLTIRDKRLYRASFRTFEEYCNQRWSMGRAYVNRIIAAADVVANLAPIGAILPQIESQARPLASLAPELQPIAWQQAIEAADGKPVTAKVVQHVVNELKPINDEFKQVRNESPEAAAELIEKAASKPHVAFNSGQNEWYTPDYILDAIREMFDIDMDPASSDIANERVQAHTYYTIEQDGLKYEWRGNVFLNPPYSQPQIGQFINKLANSPKIHHFVVLVNNATETQWGQQLLSISCAVCFPKGRIRFIDPAGNEGQSPLQGQMICYGGDWADPNLFFEHFSKFGICLPVA